jgi:RimJ/RimL family protein N-acetyltransferase
MLHGIRFNEPADGVAIARTAGTTFNALVDRCISRVTPDGNLLGGVVYTGYTGPGGSISVHVSGYDPRWINRNLSWVCADYPFNQLGVRKIIGQIPSWNDQSLRFATNLGFLPECVIKDMYPDGDCIVLSMYREHCRFLLLTPRRVRIDDGQ